MCDCIVLISGGLDSTVLLHSVAKGWGLKPLGLSFYYKQRHKRELVKAHIQCLKLNVPWLKIDLGNIISTASALTGGKEVPTAEEVEGDPQPASYVPFRNTIFLSIAMGIAEARGIKKVFYGAQQRDFDGYWDCTSDYLMQMQKVAYLNRKHKIILHAPFMDWERKLIVKRGQELGVDFSETHSCYAGEFPPCGKCPSCEERRLAFEEAGIKDPLVE